jgi:hypothetical protein
MDDIVYIVDNFDTVYKVRVVGRIGESICYTNKYGDIVCTRDWCSTEGRAIDLAKQERVKMISRYNKSIAELQTTEIRLVDWTT